MHISLEYFVAIFHYNGNNTIDNCLVFFEYGYVIENSLFVLLCRVLLKFYQVLSIDLLRIDANLAEIDNTSLYVSGMTCPWSNNINFYCEFDVLKVIFVWLPLQLALSIALYPLLFRWRVS